MVSGNKWAKGQKPHCAGEMDRYGGKGGGGVGFVLVPPMWEIVCSGIFKERQRPAAHDAPLGQRARVGWTPSALIALLLCPPSLFSS